MTEREIINRLREQAERGHMNAAPMLAYFQRTTPEERAARRRAAVERYRQRVEGEVAP